MPFNSPFMSLTFSRHVRFIFHACPVLSLRVISLHLPSCRLVSLCFVSLSFPLHSPCFHFCPLHVPFSSPLFPFHFPLLSCHVDFLFPPLISLHFLAFPLCSPIIPAKTLFSSVSTIRMSKNVECFQIFGKRRQEPQTSKEPAGGIEPGTPVLRRLVARHQIAARSGGGGGATPKPCIIDVSWGTKTGVILYPLRHGNVPPPSPMSRRVPITCLSHFSPILEGILHS